MSLRLVHFDLKGAPPSVDYLSKVFPLLKKWGATGLLIEYEDTFPYSGDLQILRSDSAYSPNEIIALQKYAADNELKIVPLVQTFGHLEFVLKHPRFHHLREVSNYPMTICPQHKDSLSLICSMVDQIISAHKDLEFLHIGADEVFHLGLCDQCLEYLSTFKKAKSGLFFEYINKLCDEILSGMPNLRLIAWDDMFRKADISLLKSARFEPMVWQYTRLLSFPDDMWKRYNESFEHIWVASAFKGATGPCMTRTDIGFHIENHQAWLGQMPEINRLQGIAITGWSRYDHFSVICELLPAALPCLSLCLLSLTNGFTLEVHRQATQDLKFSELIPLNLVEGQDLECEFPGSEIFKLLFKHVHLARDSEYFFRNDQLNGCLSPYQIQTKSCNPCHLEPLNHHANVFLDRWRHLADEMQVALSSSFSVETVVEWIAVNITPYIKRLKKISKESEAMIQYGALPNTPYTDNTMNVVE